MKDEQLWKSKDSVMGSLIASDTVAHVLNHVCHHSLHQETNLRNPPFTVNRLKVREYLIIVGDANALAGLCHAIH